MRQQLNDILVTHTGQTMEQIDNDTDRDRFMTSHEALKYGLIDEVLSKDTRGADRPNRLISGSPAITSGRDDIGSTTLLDAPLPDTGA